MVTTIESVTPVPAVADSVSVVRTPTHTQTYSLEALKRQREALVQQKIDQAAQVDAAIAEIDQILASINTAASDAPVTLQKEK